MTSRILSIDTTTEFGSLALVAGQEIVEEILLHSTDGFGHILYPHLERLLAARHWDLGEIDCFAATSGPGSFTGVRIGLAAVKGLGEALQKPVVAVSNLKAIASLGTAPLRAVALDARRGEIYGAVYSAALAVISPEIVSRFSTWVAALPDERLEFLSTDFSPFRQALSGTRFEHAPVREVPRALAGATGRIAVREFELGLARNSSEIDANYVRRSDAELFWKD